MSADDQLVDACGRGSRSLAASSARATAPDPAGSLGDAADPARQAAGVRIALSRRE